MITVHVEQLRTIAKEVDVKLTRVEALGMLRRRGADHAGEHVRAMGALMTLASAYGHTLDELAAGRRLDRHDGDYEKAAAQLTQQMEERRARAFGRAFLRLEREHFVSDARKRYAVFIVNVEQGRLGWQASMLLAAAADAGLTGPDAVGYRKRLEQIVGEEIDVRFPTRDDVVLTTAGSRHLGMLEQATREEEQAKQMVLGRAPELAQRIDVLSSSRASRARIVGLLGEIRGRLKKRAESGSQGWVADIERYKREVLDAAKQEALRAS